MLQLVRLGNPALRSRSKAVSKKQITMKRFQDFLDELAAVCIRNDGVGIASPQVGVNMRVIVVHVDPKNPRYENKQPFPLTIVINPKVVQVSSEKKDDWEGDLSADVRALVPRPTACTVTGLDRQGKAVKYTLQDDFHARVFQHEIDHLNGVLFIDKVKRKKSFSEYETWKKYYKGKDISTLDI